jgi:uncharacterized protein YdhG (YjbR/CyaY superfamily)
MKTGEPRSETVSEYIADFPPKVRAALRRVRAAIRKALPEASETISYRIPTYRINGKAVIYFAGWQEHFSIYPSGARLVEAFKDELSRYELSKGTIRFPVDEPVPVALIERIATFKAREYAEALPWQAAKTHKAAPRKPVKGRRR